MDLKSTLYSIARQLGLFQITSRLTASGARVLCYHGVVPDDDDLAAFQPKLFMRQSTLRRRLDTLVRHGYSVVGLDEAAARLHAAAPLRRAVVLTFDDGWHGTFHYGLPILAERSMPCTIYVASADCVSGHPVYNVTVQYLLWKFGRRALDLTATEFQAYCPTPLRFAANAMSDARLALLQLGTRLTLEQQTALLRHLVDAFGPEAEEVLTSRRLRLATLEELRASRGPLVSLQLHTHSHDAPVDSEREFAAEVVENRRALAAAGADGLRHFCYPSGRFAPQHAPWLASLGVETATTTVPGLWTAKSDRHFIPRFVDSDAFPDSVFDAELRGFQDAMRAARRIISSPASRA